MALKRSLAAAALATAVVFAAAPAMAAPATGLSLLKGIGQDQSQVEQVHGWHRRCMRGLNGFHRHVPGVGRIQCTTRRCVKGRWGRLVCTWY